MQAIAAANCRSDRAAALLDNNLNVIHRRADRLFAWLMIAQWIAGIGAALWISPRTWIGAESQTHWHVWAAIFLGGALASLPVYFAHAMPGRALTRHTIAVAQMLFSALLIHLTGGRIETHFHVFGSLAFLAFYRDWRVLITATVVVAADHATRGIFFPQSVFGILTASPWRWIEHAGWVLFEDFFLFISIHQSTQDMIEVAAHRADLEVGGEQRLAQAQRMAHVGSWEWNVVTNEVIWSDEQYRLFGLEPGERAASYDLYLSFVHPDARAGAVKWFNAVRAMKKSSHMDILIVRADGEERILNSWAEVVLDEAGNVVRVAGTSQDVTERKAADTALQEAEEKYRSIFEHSNDGIFQNTPDGRFLSANPALARMLGFDSPEELIRERGDIERQGYADPTMRDKFKQALEENGCITGFEYEVYRKDGAKIWVAEHSRVIRDAEGRALYYEGSVQDITERKRAEEELKRSEERLAAAQKMAHVGSWEWNVVTNEVIWSDEEYRLFGLEPGERAASYDLYLSFVHPDAREDAIKWFNAVRAMKKSSRTDILIVRADGEERILNSWADVVLDESGNVVRLIGTSQDVTEREKAERALGESEERFRLVSRATNDAIWDWDVVANVISFSESFGTLFGYRAGEFESTMELEVSRVHPDDHDELMAGLHAFFAGREEAWSGEYRYRCADGSYAFVYDRGHVVRDADGKPLRMVGSMMNITERKRAEEELTRSRLRLAEAQRLAHIGSWEWNLTTQKVTWSDEQYRLFGFSPGEIEPSYERYFECIHPDDREAVRKFAEMVVETRQPASMDLRVVHSNGRVRVLHRRAEILLDDAGNPIRMVGTMQDVTELRQKESELLLAKSTAEAASRAKSEFLANMSHEIRTPMNGIIGMTDLTLETDLNRDQREYLGMVKSSAHSLLGLINDILDFSKIEAGKLELESIDFSLRDCIGSMLKPLGIRADQKSLELVADITPGVPDHLVGDPMRLQQILINLIDNAIKFTERGEVVVKVINWAAPDGESHLHFSVADTGIGIPTEQQSAIFGAFAQADGSTTRTHGGTGLGLSIASRLIRKMQGKIWIESKVGEGTTFHFTARLGLRDTPAPTVKHADPRDLAGLRALVVDDNAVNRRILREMLVNWRMSPTLVESGQAGLDEMLRAAKSDSAYQLVLLDAVMPEMDGFALAEKIKDQPELADATVMMLSSAMAAGSAARCGALGIAGFLTKPVTQSELLDAILIAVSRGAEGGNSRDVDAGIAGTEPAGSGLRILVAEDNLVNRAVARGILEKEGHVLVHAGTGREAVEAFSDGSFDLILMDVQMPEMDGFEATRRIRELEEATGGHTTIVAMTAHAMAGDRERCLVAGMDDYVSKPLRKEDLLRALDGAGREDDDDETETTLLYSREQLLEQCDGDEELMRELVAIFHDNTPQIVQGIGEAVEKRDAPALAAHAHKLLSSLGVFGAGRARALALRLEKHGQESDFGGAKERFTELERETDTIYVALADFVSALA